MTIIYVLIFSVGSAGGRSNEFFIYDNVIFTGNVEEVSVTDYFQYPPSILEECISYCLQTKLCDAVFITYDDGSSILEQCRFYNIELNIFNLMAAENYIPELSDEPWYSIWPTGEPGISKLIIIGILFRSGSRLGQ